ncbi:MAG: periplasmic heavy metal sensor [Verrucomicrobia bacterium]|nr:periplasmic heavy metal sensor [Verrucomicrobiota bacterium]
MKSPLQLLAVLFVVAIVSVGACAVTFRFLVPLHSSNVSSHEWIHHQLNLTAEQERALEPIEAEFQQRKRELLGQIESANNELAQVIKEDQGYSTRVSAAIEKIHHAQGELQEATLQHVFAMRAMLTPEQYQKLLDLTAGALSEINRGE